MSTDNSRDQATIKPDDIRGLTPKMRTYTFKRRSGDTETVNAEAATVDTCGELLFMIGDRIVLAVSRTDRSDLKEVMSDKPTDARSTT